MAFNIQSWGRTSGSANNNATLLQSGTWVGATNYFTYVSVDSVGTMSAANYFNEVAAELNVGDLIHAVNVNSSGVFVSSVDLSVDTVTVGPVPAVTTTTTGSPGDVTGPASSTDNAVARFNGTDGKTIQNSVVIVDDVGVTTGMTQLTVDNLRLDGNVLSSTSGAVTITPLAGQVINLDNSNVTVDNGVVTVTGNIAVDNLDLNGNTLSSTDTDGNINILPDGNGEVLLKADPVSALGAVTKQYVDASNTNQTWKDAVTVASTTAFTVTYDNGTAGVGATLTNAGAQAALEIDGVTVTLNSRVLIKDQASALENGIYTATDLGSGATNWVLTRATDFDETAEMSAGSVVPVIGGVINANTAWMLDATVTTVGTTAVDFTVFIEGTGLWLEQTSTPVTLVPQISYVANTGGLLTFNMPATANFGDVFEVAGTGAGGWLIQFTTGQTAHLGGVATTITTGSFASSSQYDAIEFICTEEDTTFVVIKAVGNITVV